MTAVLQRGRRVGATTAVAVAALVLGSACGMAHNGLGTTASSCFKALPVATSATHERGHFVGVRAVTPATARGLLAGHTDVTPEPDDLEPTTTSSEPASSGSPAGGAATTTSELRHRICLVALRGTFPAGTVADAVRVDGSDGPYAVVVVRLRDRRAVGTVIVDHLPFRFQHL